MRRYKVAYVERVLAVGLGSVAVTFAYPDNEVLLMAVAYWVFAVADISIRLHCISNRPCPAA